MRHLLRWREWLERVPAPCPGCGRRVAGQGLCAACAQRLHPAPAPRRCVRCAHPLPPAGTCPDCARHAFAFVRAVAAFDYADLGRELVQQYKGRHRLELTALLAGEMAAAIARAGPLAAGWPHWIVPVPAHPASLRRRGFSPPAELARSLAQRLRVPHRLDLLRQLRPVVRQAQRDWAARWAAHRADDHAVAWPRGTPAAPRVAIVDDVLTTGATLHGLAQRLRQEGAACVEVWVLARTPNDYDDSARASRASRASTAARGPSSPAST